MSRQQQPDYEALAQGAIMRAREFSLHWHRIEAIIPVEARPVWEEVRLRMQMHGIVHDNLDVENGMIIEMLSAEFLAGPLPPYGEE